MAEVLMLPSGKASLGPNLVEMPLQKITSVASDRVPELAGPAELLQTQEGRKDMEAGAAH